MSEIETRETGRQTPDRGEAEPQVEMSRKTKAALWGALVCVVVALRDPAARSSAVRLAEDPRVRTWLGHASQRWISECDD